MHPVNLVDPEALHHSVIHHLAASATALFGWLEDDRDGAVEVPRLGEVLGRAQKHRGVTVVPTGMHHTIGL